MHQVRNLIVALGMLSAAGSAAPTITVGPNLGTWSIGPIQLALTANGTGAVTWAVTSGSLPPGLALRTDVPSFFPANASAGLIGVAITPNATAYSFTLTAMD